MFCLCTNFFIVSQYLHVSHPEFLEGQFVTFKCRDTAQLSPIDDTLHNFVHLEWPSLLKLWPEGIDLERFFAWVVNSIKIDGQLKCDVLVGRRPTAFETQTIRNEINKKWRVIPVQHTSLILHVLLRQSRNYPLFLSLQN